METIGDAYMIVGGVPEKSDNHALEVAEMAFDMLRCMKGLRNPADKQTKSHLKLRIGRHQSTAYTRWVLFEFTKADKEKVIVSIFCVRGSAYKHEPQSMFPNAIYIYKVNLIT